MSKLLRRKMKDIVNLYTVSKNGYGDITTTAVVTIPALIRVGQALQFQQFAQNVQTDGQMWVDPTIAASVNVAGRLKGMIVRAQKQKYAEASNAEHWFLITEERVSTDSLRTNSTAFIKCALQKIEKPDGLS